MIVFTELEKRFLQALGKTENGKQLIELFGRMRDTYADIDTIEPGSDYGAEVEGRKMFKTFIKDITTQMKSRPHGKIGDIGNDSYE